MFCSRYIYYTDAEFGWQFGSKEQMKTGAKISRNLNTIEPWQKTWEAVMPISVKCNMKKLYK